MYQWTILQYLVLCNYDNLASYFAGTFDIVVVNLYPFYDKVSSSRGISFEDGIENIDIGGPAMIRAAAKVKVIPATPIYFSILGDLLTSLIFTMNQQELFVSYWLHYWWDSWLYWGGGTAKKNWDCFRTKLIVREIKVLLDILFLMFQNKIWNSGHEFLLYFSIFVQKKLLFWLYWRDTGLVFNCWNFL